ncbi:MAG: response regulator transcription factor [Chloroflexi bacterium]|nr:response regulator transcription factor [Chloroflexota bacterium]MCI0575757.1 response regulator transcription factor [Chloroflexota bacterium]MCI0643636.1 response regulator transcription factor [Chloroflexota bacterium]MCI0729823.1 response regulator transcription factor [Chloroflexota bacterium]
MTTQPSPGRILVVDDEANIRNGLRVVLAKDGHEVRDTGTAKEALALLATFPCEVAIVDIRMPGMSGVELLAAIRDRWPYTAVILLTGHGTLETAMTAVKAGAADYLLKPAQPEAIRQAVATALAAARRHQEQAHLLDSLRTGLQRLEELPATPPPAGSPSRTQDLSGERLLVVGEIQVDRQAHEVRRGGEPVSLSPSEFNLLVALAERAGRVVDYMTLVRLVLAYEAEPWEAKELIKRHIFALRQKIEADPASPRYILNVRGIGYRLAMPEAGR